MAERLQVALEAARGAGALLMRHFEGGLKFRQKADRTFVSRADEESEALIRHALLGAFASDAFNGEETGRSGAADPVWHVDPLDGTANFMHGAPGWCVSIGLQHRGEFVLGVIHEPLSGHTWCAERGGGASCNGKRLRVSTQPFENGLHLVDSYFGTARAQPKLKYVAALAALAPNLRMSGCSALQLAGVASGQYLSSLSDTVKTWDFAAGAVLVREAGGVIAALEGELTADSAVVIAANSHQTLERLRSLAR